MTVKLGVLMDPIESILPYKDTSMAMLLEAQRRGWQIHYMEQKDLFLSDGIVSARMHSLEVQDTTENWFTKNDEQVKPLHELDVVLMRKDPPFNTGYIFTTYLLELAEKQGVLVVNKPQALRDANEKLFTAWFPELCPPTLVTRDAQLLREFLNEHQKVIFKPLGGMGGVSIFLLERDNPNFSVIVETLTENATQYIMAQRFIPEIKQGDKRIIMINGEPIPYGLSRIPSENDIRGNLAAGAKGVGATLTKRELEICERVGPVLKEKGLVIAGLDVIGDFLTEINVTSPTCVREIDKAFNLNISAKFFDVIETML